MKIFTSFVSYSPFILSFLAVRISLIFLLRNIFKNNKADEFESESFWNSEVALAIIAFVLPRAINIKYHSHIKTLKDATFINSNLCAVLCNKFVLFHFSLTC